MGTISNALDKYQQRVDYSNEPSPYVSDNDEKAVIARGEYGTITNHPAFIDAIASAAAPVFQVSGYALSLGIIGLCLIGLGYFVENNVKSVAYAMGIIMALSSLALSYYGGQRALQKLIPISLYISVMGVFLFINFAVITIASALTTPSFENPATRESMISSAASIGISPKLLFIILVIAIIAALFSQKDAIGAFLMQNNEQSQKK